MVSLKMMVYFLFVFLLIGLLTKTNNNENNKMFDNNSAIMTKGITALLIVIGHCISAIKNPDLAIFNVGYFGVAVFYFWSGYGITISWRKNSSYVDKFWRNRLVKVLIPFITAHLVYVPIKLFMGHKFTFMSFVESFFGQCTIVDNSWYPFSILIFYFLFWIAIKFINSKRNLSLILLLGTLGITSFEIIILPKYIDWWMISNLSFPLGTIIALYFDDYKLNKTIFLSVFMCVIGIVIMPLSNIIFNEYIFSLYVLSCNLMSAGIGLLSIISFSVLRGENKLIKNIGKISYEIYLLHGIVIVILRSFGFNNILLIPLVMIISIIISYPVNMINNYLLKSFLNYER